MKLVQILLPLRDNHGRKFKIAVYSKIHKHLVKTFRWTYRSHPIASTRFVEFKGLDQAG